MQQLFFNKFQGISKFTDPCPGPLAVILFYIRINISEVKIRPVLKKIIFIKVENVKGWYRDNNCDLRKKMYSWTIFTKRFIVDLWQGSKCASSSKCAMVLNIACLHRVLNMSEYAWIIPRYGWLCLNMLRYAWLCQDMCEHAYIYF